MAVQVPLTPVLFQLLPGEGVVHVRWNTRFTASYTDQLLHEELMRVHGVERVTVFRYSALVYYAGHVVDGRTLVERVQEQLFGAPGARYATQFVAALAAEGLTWHLEAPR